jgi:hypothetical protein
MSRNRTLPLLIAALAAALSLVLAASAQAAQPKAGSTYTGFISTGAHLGFKPPVSFKVSVNGKLLRGFKWAGDGCLGLGGPGDPWTNPYFNNEVGTINVSPSGTFSVKNVKWTTAASAGNAARVTISTVNGRFTTANTATGTITFTLKSMGRTCAPATVRFTAATH